MKNKLFTLTLLLSLTSALHAREIADVKFAETVSIAGTDQALKLNGLGIRSKFFFKIYIAALYLKNPSKNAAEIIASDSAKRIVMHFLYDEVAAEKLVAGWNDGFEDNLSDDELKSLSTDIKQFNQMFETLKEGDVVTLDYLPKQGTRITIKGVNKGIIKGAAFNQALLKIWLGDEPVTDDLKEALLGEE